MPTIEIYTWRLGFSYSSVIILMFLSSGTTCQRITRILCKISRDKTFKNVKLHKRHYFNSFCIRINCSHLQHLVIFIPNHCQDISKILKEEYNECGLRRGVYFSHKRRVLSVSTSRCH